jgi:hypothetical protein
MSVIREIRSATLLSFPTDHLRRPVPGPADRRRIALICRWEHQADGTLACVWQREGSDRPSRRPDPESPIPETDPLSSGAQRGTFLPALRAPRFARGDSDRWC